MTNVNPFLTLALSANIEKEKRICVLLYFATRVSYLSYKIQLGTRIRPHPLSVLCQVVS